MAAAFWTGALAGYGIAIPVGAIAILIVEWGLRHGFRPAFVAGAGAASADLFYSGVAVVGGVAIARLLDSSGRVFSVSSALILAAIAIRGLIRSRLPFDELGSTPRPSRRQLGTTYLRFLGLTIVNPATVVYFVAVIVGLGIADDFTFAEGTAFVFGAFLASLSWQTTLAAVGAYGSKRVSDRGRRLALILGNTLILVLALSILIRG